MCGREKVKYFLCWDDEKFALNSWIVVFEVMRLVMKWMLIWVNLRVRKEFFQSIGPFYGGEGISFSSRECLQRRTNCNFFPSWLCDCSWDVERGGRDTMLPVRDLYHHVGHALSKPQLDTFARVSPRSSVLLQVLKPGDSGLWMWKTLRGTW